MTFNLKKSFIFLFFFAAPFIDALTGELLFSGKIEEGSLFSPSQIFRFLLTFYALLLLKSNHLSIVLTVVFYVLITELISFFFHKNFLGFLTGLVYSYKLVFILITFFVIRLFYLNTSGNLLLNHIVKSGFLYSFILLFSIILGIDESTYNEGAFGSKGLFASGNGLSLFLGVSSVLAFQHNKLVKTRASLLYYIVLVVSTVLVGTKGSIVFFCINLFLLIFKSKKNFYFFIIILAVLIIFFIQKIIDMFSTAFDVIILRFNSSETFFQFLASNRDNYIIDAFQVFGNSSFIPFRIIFGSGVFLSFRDYNNLNLPYDTLESDFFDILFSYGLIGLFLYLTLIFWGIYICIKKQQFVYFITWISLCTYSLIAGHMLFNSMSNIAFLILIILIKMAPKYSNEK